MSWCDYASAFCVSIVLIPFSMVFHSDCFSNTSLTAQWSSLLKRRPNPHFAIRASTNCVSFSFFSHFTSFILLKFPCSTCIKRLAIGKSVFVEVCSVETIILERSYEHLVLQRRKSRLKVSQKLLSVAKSCLFYKCIISGAQHASIERELSSLNEQIGDLAFNNYR